MNDMMVKRVIDVVVLATGLTESDVSKIFNFTQPFDVSTMLVAFNKDFDQGYYTNYLSLGFMLPKLLVSSDGTAALNNANYLAGVTYMQKNVIMDELLKIYPRTNSDLMNDTILELIQLMHGVNASQVKAIHNLTSAEISEIEIVSFKDLDNVGIVLNVATLEELLRVAAKLGKYLYIYLKYLPFFCLSFLFCYSMMGVRDILYHRLLWV